MKGKIILAATAFLLLFTTAHAQEDAKGDIRLFQSFFEDAHVTPELYLDGEFDYSYYDNTAIAGDYDLFNAALRAGFPVTPETELHMRLGLVHLDMTDNSETSVSDLYLGGRHMLIDRETKVSAGGFVTLPTGKEEAGEDNSDIGIYSALRHPVSSEIVLTGTIGLAYTEKPPVFSGDHESVLRLGGGAIYQYSDELNFIGEAVIESRYDYMLISGGVDYAVDRKSNLRGSLGVGVDQDAPDVNVSLSYYFMF